MPSMASLESYNWADADCTPTTWSIDERAIEPDADVHLAQKAVIPRPHGPASATPLHSRC